MGALIDVGVPVSHLRSQLSMLGIDSEFKLTCSPGKKQGISGTRVDVSCKTHHAHRHLPQIQKIIENSSLSESVATKSLKIFENLAQAEGKIHGIEPEQVHFHEVGATDAIVDIVGAVIGLEYLNPDAVLCGPIELGSGMVKCEHGMMPVPAPATAELLKNRVTTRGGLVGEATTPTGAAIVSTLADSAKSIPPLDVKKIGYGIGFKDFSIPNVLRVSLAESTEILDLDVNVEIECNLDDMTPEAFGPLFEQLLNDGALDVFVTPIQMKKSRPAHKLTVLAKRDDAQDLINSVLSNTTTIGVRTHFVSKSMLPRETKQLGTRYGKVNVKFAKLPDGTSRHKVEHEDIQSIVRKHGVSYFTAKMQIELDIQGNLNHRG